MFSNMTKANQLVRICLFECSKAPIFWSDPTYGMPRHILSHINATTPVGMYLRYKIRPLRAFDVFYCGRSKRVVRICLFGCSQAPIFCTDNAYGVPRHTLSHTNATTPVGMYFRFKVGPLQAIDVVYCGKGNRVLRSCLFECSVAPIFWSEPTYGMPRHILSHINATTPVGMYF